ncbi:hypothetical protein PR048_029829 [Dryococelus australis]|uniref:Uncharacterized protein n=1 Tax=Dryococelus australis TaxID=614101 RepID=A0ABQ9G782_9NEOP|nr:hypothetical protein PR048_029829 [Dryococelus australis]
MKVQSRNTVLCYRDLQAQRSHNNNTPRYVNSRGGLPLIAGNFVTVRNYELFAWCDIENHGKPKSGYWERENNPGTSSVRAQCHISLPPRSVMLAWTSRRVGHKQENATITSIFSLLIVGATVAERLARSPPTIANRAQSPAGSPDFRVWISCRTMPLVGGSSRGSPASPAPSFRRCSIFTSLLLILKRITGNLLLLRIANDWTRMQEDAGSIPGPTILTSVSRDFLDSLQQQATAGLVARARLYFSRRNSSFPPGRSGDGPRPSCTAISAIFLPEDKVQPGVLRYSRAPAGSGCPAERGENSQQRAGNRVAVGSYARLYHRGLKLDPRSVLRSKLKTVAPFEFRAGLKIGMKFISNRRNWWFEILMRDQQPSSTKCNRGRCWCNRALVAVLQHREKAALLSARRTCAKWFGRLFTTMRVKRELQCQTVSPDFVVIGFSGLPPTMDANLKTYSRQNPPISGIFWPVSHVRKSGSNPTGDRTRFTFVPLRHCGPADVQWSRPLEGDSSRLVIGKAYQLSYASKQVQGEIPELKFHLDRQFIEAPGRHLEDLISAPRHAGLSTRPAWSETIYPARSTMPGGSRWPMKRGRPRNPDPYGSRSAGELHPPQHLAVLTALYAGCWLFTVTNTGKKGRWKREIPEKTRRPAASPGTISTWGNPGVTRPMTEDGSPCWEASRLTAQPSRARD